MTCLPLNLSTEARQNCCSYLSVVFFLYNLVGVAYVFVGAFVQRSIASFGHVVYERYSSAYPDFMIAVGIIIIGAHLFGTKIVLMIGDWRNMYLKPYRTQNVMTAYLAVMLIIPIILLIFSLVSFSQEGLIRDAFYEGFIDGMHRYRTEIDLKVGIDRTQMIYQCCGALSYEDWFQINWVDVAFVDKFDSEISKHIHNGEFFTESVPFSCCSVKAQRPCISNFVHDKTRHFEYHPEKEMTIYQDSCADVTSRFMRKVVKRVGRFSVCVFFVSVTNLIVYRYVQTSLVTAATWGDPTQIAAGYLALFGSKSPAPPERPQNFDELAQREKELTAMAGAKPQEKQTNTMQDAETGKTEKKEEKEEEEYEPLTGAGFNVSTNANRRTATASRYRSINTNNRRSTDWQRTENGGRWYWWDKELDIDSASRHDMRHRSRRRSTTDDNDRSQSRRRSTTRREQRSSSRTRSRLRRASQHQRHSSGCSRHNKHHRRR